MQQVRFIGCLHLGHENMAKRRGFTSSQEHDEYLIEQWNSVVNKHDTVWILGDVTMEKTHPYPLLKQMRGVKKVVLGNHDKPGHVPELLKYVNSVSGMVQYKGFWLTHAPVHPFEMSYGKIGGNIHAHIHEAQLIPFLDYPDAKYYNVDAHKIDYKPKTIEELIP